ncbi:hypothetical protein EU527_12270 [Candidatus Thorarchaeota archaeon]|nr:MAG: hypothetical protein EU527_12270 [Candidatus Thorarchaeota archaeon]
MTDNSSRSPLDSALALLQNIQNRIMSPSEFQREQMNLKHSILLDNEIVGCHFDQVLVEILRELRLGIILDRSTSRSRTSWLAGIINNQNILIVLDSVTRKEIVRASIDVWSNIEELPQMLLDVIRETSLGEVSGHYRAIDFSWHLIKENDIRQLVIEISSNKTDSQLLDEEILFFVDYQGIVTERFRAEFPVGNERISVAIDLADIRASYEGKMNDAYLTLYVSDADWKSVNRYHQIRYSWKEALTHQIYQDLADGIRYTSFDELSQNLNLTYDNNSLLAKMLFFDFCKSLDVAGCKSQRVSDHCSRAIILTALVICFNPPRGLSGYLEMVLGNREFEFLLDLGSERTWRDHLSAIVNLAQDFRPITIKFTGSKKTRKPGRPPTQLIPKTPPGDLLMNFIEAPDSIVCRLCRFNDSQD